MSNIFSTLDSTTLLLKYGTHQLNEFRTIQQAWDRLNSTPYHPDKAESYSKLRQIMLRKEVSQ